MIRRMMLMHDATLLAQVPSVAQDLTTTLYHSSTTTETITLIAVPTAQPSSASQSSQSVAGPAVSGGQTCVAEVVTVTATVTETVVCHT